MDADIHSAEYLGDRWISPHTTKLYGITVTDVRYTICLRNHTLEHIYVMSAGTLYLTSK